ncbi:MAG: rRNA maturation RNase YbeY [Verrucomicrobiae bacterium]|nr:rRNA maturation RNase YbeY [Verrucomicrobiae bacterium]
MPTETSLRFTLRNRQKLRAIDTRHFRRVLRHYLHRILEIERSDLCFHLVDAPEMTRINERFLNHTGSTDVITFDHRDDPGSGALYGEIFICVADALKQSRQFRCDWTNELIRYAVHGVLHLCGYDDLTESARREMKKAENRCLRKLGAEFNFALLERQ